MPIGIVVIGFSKQEIELDLNNFKTFILIDLKDLYNKIKIFIRNFPKQKLVITQYLVSISYKLKKLLRKGKFKL